MTKATTKKIEKMGFSVFCLNSNNYYIKNGGLENQINIKKIGSGIFGVYGEGIETKPMCENSILEMLK